MADETIRIRHDIYKELENNLHKTHELYKKMKEEDDLDSARARSIIKLLSIQRKCNDIWKEELKKLQEPGIKAPEPDSFETDLSLPVKVLFYRYPAEPRTMEEPGCDAHAEIEAVMLESFNIYDYLPEDIANEITKEALYYCI